MHWSSTQFRLSCFFSSKKFLLFCRPSIAKESLQETVLFVAIFRGRDFNNKRENTVLGDNPILFKKKNVSKKYSGILVLVLKGHHLPQFVISTLCPFVNYRQILEEGTNKSKPSSLEGKMSGINWPHHIVHSLKHVGGPTLRPWGWGFQSRLWFAWKIIHTVYWKLQIRTHERKSKLDVAHFSCCCIKRKREI